MMIIYEIKYGSLITVITEINIKSKNMRGN